MEKPNLCFNPRGQRVVELARRIEEYLDAGHGGVLLRQPTSRAWLNVRCFIRRTALSSFSLVHHAQSRHCAELKRGKAFHWLTCALVEILYDHKANGLLQRTGEFWQREYLDSLRCATRTL